MAVGPQVGDPPTIPVWLLNMVQTLPPKGEPPRAGDIGDFGELPAELKDRPGTTALAAAVVRATAMPAIGSAAAGDHASAQETVTGLLREVQRDARALDQKMMMARVALQTYMGLRSTQWGAAITGEPPTGSEGARLLETAQPAEVVGLQVPVSDPGVASTPELVAEPPQEAEGYGPT